MTTHEGVSFAEAAQKAFVATEEIFREPPPVALSLPSALAQDPLLSVEDFTVEHACPAPSRLDVPTRHTMPTGSLTQISHGLMRYTHIVLDNDKQLFFLKKYSFIQL